MAEKSVTPKPAMNQQPKAQGRRTAPNQAPHVQPKVAPSQPYAQTKKVPQGSIGISGELEIMMADHQKSQGKGSLVRASSSNVMLFGNLGNLRHPGAASSTLNYAPDYVPKHSSEEIPKPNNSKYGNTANKSNEEAEQEGSLCRALSTRMDPESLKIMGNEDYKNGNFAEALAFYEQAISLDPKKAAYRSNKSAALTALGRLLDAVFECREAIRIEPQYHRAHYRLANLYLRLGEADKALYHLKHSGPEADSQDLSRGQSLQAQLKKCTEAWKLRDWNTLVKEAAQAISAGADSAPQIFALQAEALLKLHRHQDADETLAKGPHFDNDACTKFFGPIGNANLLQIHAQVDLAAGRFDDALEAAERATRLDPNNKEASMVHRRARAMAAARARGNDLFKAAKFSEACLAYVDGLEHDPYNSVLLCNRAACRSRLGQFENAVEDCTTALNVRPSYSKARLRRADCNAKLERWEAAVKDYEILLSETPDNEEVSLSLSEAKSHLKNQKGSEIVDTKFSCENVIVISSKEQFKEYVTSPGVSVALFCNQPGDRQTLEYMEKLCKKFPSVNFLKVEVEDHQYLAKSEVVSSLPAFKLYKNGSRVKEIPGDNLELLESSVKYHST
ncbi:hypothetical protein RJ641_011735 [Dillenia turbinata]|uniref:Thioredoxin domain-containing protein n=1 Tax=Dillenia turbinata TaxID=194707 RepID=A0AAN8Z3I4_9MAGN